jgi:hypothetical protein
MQKNANLPGFIFDPGIGLKWRLLMVNAPINLLENNIALSTFALSN